LKRIQDWPKLEDAIEEKIHEQQSAVHWWGNKVTPNYGGDRQVPRSTDLIPYRQAEQMIGFSNQTISAWGRALADREKYRAKLLGVEYRAAMLSPADNHRAQGTGENEWYTPKQYIEAARGSESGRFLPIMPYLAPGVVSVYTE
jgi:hypothetical protein